MPMMKNVLGLDLGSHTIKAVELKQTLRGLEPVQVVRHPDASVHVDRDAIGEAQTISSERHRAAGLQAGRRTDI